MYLLNNLSEVTKMKTTHDPYDGRQISFERTDRTGRWSPIVEQDEDWSAVYIVSCIIVFCVYVAWIIIY